VRVLFFPHEQYLPFEYEASNFEVRLPAINCGLITDSETFVYQRIFRSHGREEMNKQAWEFAKSFSPDIVIHYRTWPFPVDENLDHSLINTIDREIAPVLTIVFDSYSNIHQFEMEAFTAPSYFGMLTSIYDFLRYKKLEKICNYETQVTTLIGHNVLTELFKPIDFNKKNIDVSFIGSIYGMREEWLKELNKRLSTENIKLTIGGGNFNSKLEHKLGFRGVNWLSYEEYIDIISRSKICLNLPSINDHTSQIKGRLFELLSCNTLCFNKEDEANKIFLPSRGIVGFNSISDCSNKIIEYLRNPKKIDKESSIGNEWYMRNFNYKEFWRELLKLIYYREKLSIPELFQRLSDKFIYNKEYKSISNLSSKLEIEL